MSTKKKQAVIWFRFKYADEPKTRAAVILAADGQALESKVIGRQYHFVCTACGARCKAANLTGDRPDCHKGYPAAEWKETR